MHTFIRLANSDGVYFLQTQEFFESPKNRFHSALSFAFHIAATPAFYPFNISFVLLSVCGNRKGKERHTKTDRIDAQLISRELKDGRLEGIIVPGKEREELRSLFRRRNELVKDLRRIKCMIKMQLLYFGIKVPPEFDNDHWSHAFRHWVDSQQFNFPTARETMASKMRTFRFIDKELRDVSSQLRAYVVNILKRTTTC